MPADLVRGTEKDRRKGRLQCLWLEQLKKWNHALWWGGKSRRSISEVDKSETQL